MSNGELAPRLISSRRIGVCLDDFILLWDETTDRVYQFGMPGTDDLFVAVFSSESTLQRFHRQFGFPIGRTKRITNGLEFLSEVRGVFRVALDLYQKPNGRTGYIEVRETNLPS